MALYLGTPFFIEKLNPKLTMARITVEDCVTVVPNRFELCLVASNRAKSILSGAATSLDRKEKPAVISLREIADELIDVDAIKKNIVRSIKNRGTAESIQSGSEVTEMLEEEIQSQSLVLKDTAFVDENISVDD
ncbi:MAG: DNA-directed RNA polymerase subunit omega [Proteobacteria bacterium]|nr:DNA-directed RNA polymerase subunit omega [Pseudomonadota bacterium]